MSQSAEEVLSPELARAARQALRDGAPDDEWRFVRVTAADARARLAALRAEHPTARVLAVADDDAGIAAALVAGADEAVTRAVGPGELRARLLRVETVAGSAESLRAANEHRARERVATTSHRLETLGTVATGLAHDFNNLLTVIIGNAAFLKEELSKDSPGQRLLSDLQGAATRAGDLTEQILRYAGGSDEPRRALDLNVLVRDVATLIRSSVAADVDLVLALSSDRLQTEADAPSLVQILVNLVQNAVDASVGPRPRVVVRTGRAPGMPASATGAGPPAAHRAAVFVEVEDEGHGMRDATRSQAFEAFFTTRGPGRGLGLSVVREVARAHAGAVVVESRPGAGTRVRVWLPEDGASPRPSEPGSPAERWISRGLVLVADDEPEVRDLLRRILVKSGFEVLDAENGETTIELVDAHPEARLLILDLTMPRRDGGEVARYLAERDLAAPPILMMSGYAHSRAKARLTGVEVAGFLKKPFLPGAVLAKVKRILHE